MPFATVDGDALNECVSMQALYSMFDLPVCVCVCVCV